jgi:ribonuclease PH
MRLNSRQNDQLRTVIVTPNVSDYAEGSCLIEFGKTKVLCTASFEAQVPKWLQNSGKGWITAEYGMLPRSTHDRNKREKTLTSGRTQEISRLIARSLRATVDLTQLNEKQITVDCDVLQADGGTRTASITGGFIALAFALKKLHLAGEIKSLALKNYVSAISVGLQGSEPLLDLDYQEDSSISTDMNFVMTNDLNLIEIQGTAEKEPFNGVTLMSAMSLAQKGCVDLFKIQEKYVGSFFSLKLQL